MLHKLPSHLIREHIIPYTYCPQNPVLCEDIRNYFTTKQSLYELYFPKSDSFSDMYDWLANDILRFMNGDLPILWHGYLKSHINTYKRLFTFANSTITDESVVNYMRWIDSGEFDSFKYVNVALAVLLPVERKELYMFLATIS